MASKLPEDVWALILAHVPVADRLKHCALVCTKLSRAAAAATDVLQVSVWSNNQQQQQQRAEAWDSYLQHHGSHITSLVLDNGAQALTQLACPQLLHLEVSRAQPLQLGLPGVLDSCRGLTSLKLSSCTVTPDGSLSRLSVLVKLRDLQVQYVRHQPSGGYATLPGSVLPSLTHLTRLDLSFIDCAEDVHHVSSLTSLSVLRISGVQGPQPLRLTPDIARGFALPASLRELKLGDAVVLEPAVFAAATQLTCVKLDTTVIEGQGGGVSSGAALLAAVAGMQQLDTLVLSVVKGVEWPAPCAAYTALTASSKLQRLMVLECGLSGAVWEHAFPPACSCPAMQEFVASEDDGVIWGAGAVSRLVRSCPGLLDLDLRLSGAPAVAALKPLAALTKLELFVDCADDESDVTASVAHIAALTNLQHVDLNFSIDEDEDDADAAAAGAAALLPLTALRGLTGCDVRVGANFEDDDVLVDLSASNEAEEGQPPDVWLQLLEQCLAASSCQPAVTAATKQLAQQHAELQQRLEQQKQQQAQQEQQHAERLAQQEQRLEQQEQQVTALQAQVQQLMRLLPQPEQQ